MADIVIFRVGDRVRFVGDTERRSTISIHVAVDSVGVVQDVVDYSGEGDPTYLVLFEQRIRGLWMESDALEPEHPLPDFTDPMAIREWLAT